MYTCTASLFNTFLTLVFVSEHHNEYTYHYGWDLYNEPKNGEGNKCGIQNMVLEVITVTMDIYLKHH